MTPAITIDLSKLPQDRWRLTDEQTRQARLLVQSYVEDLGGLETFEGMLMEYSQHFVNIGYREEIKSLSEQLGVPFEAVLLCNLYYDVFKALMGCTAFAVDTANGPIHARNLDWWTENNMLSEYTVVTHYINSSSGLPFSTIGWPGFMGAFSGIAPGRFAITLNAVLSIEPAKMAQSIALWIRTVLDKADTFEKAVEMLSEETIAADCLLLVSGTRQGEMVVIERTPTQSAIRHPDGGFIAVANDYILIDADTGEATSELATTSCGRYESALHWLKSQKPTTKEECLAILRAPTIQMGITVQQMVLQASTGMTHVQLP